MSTILEAQAVIKAKDATGGVFDSIANKVARIQRAAQALNRDVQKQMDIAGRAEQSVSRLQRASNAIGLGAKAAAGAAAAYEGSRAVRAIASHTIKSAADRGHEETRMSASGMTPDEIKEAEHLAGGISTKFPSVSKTEMMHMARNVRSMVGSYEEAAHVLEPLAQLRVVALGAHPEKAAELNEDFDKLAKGMEIKGVTQDFPKFKHYIDQMAKAINVFGDTLRPTDYYEMFKYGRGATNALSDDFMLKTAPTLAQELGGSSAGKALASFHTQFVGGKMSNKAVEALQEYGLIDPTKVIKTSTGNVKGVKPGGIVGQEFLRPGQEDPYAWVNKVMIPALAAKGVTDPSQIQEVIAAIASQQTTGQMLGIFATQQQRIEKDLELVRKALGIEATGTYQKNDPKVIRKSIDAQTDNVLGNVGQKMLPITNSGMNWMQSGLAYISGEAEQNPLRVAAGLVWGTALTAAISADSAASTIRGVGGLHRGEGALGGLKFNLTKLIAALAPIVDIATRPDVLDDSRTQRYAPIQHDRLAKLADIDADDARIDRADFGDGSEKFVAKLKAKNAERRKAIEGELTGLGFAGPDVPGRGMRRVTVEDVQKATGIGQPVAPPAPAPAALTPPAPPVAAPAQAFPYDELRAIVQGAVDAPKEPAKAEVIGNATLETTVTVSPSPDFLSRVEQRINNAINAFRSSGAAPSGSAGSTGRSMPEAGAPQ